MEKYQKLQRDVRRLCSLKKLEVVGALDKISNGFSGSMDTLGIKLNVGMVKKSVLLVKARILGNS